MEMPSKELNQLKKSKGFIKDVPTEKKKQTDN
jgi:hypothetical protein